MQHDRYYPKNTHDTPEKTPGQTVSSKIGLAVGFGLLALALALVGSLGVAAIVAVWGWIL